MAKEIEEYGQLPTPSIQEEKVNIDYVTYNSNHKESDINKILASKYHGTSLERSTLFTSSTDTCEEIMEFLLNNTTLEQRSAITVFKLDDRNTVIAVSK